MPWRDKTSVKRSLSLPWSVNVWFCAGRILTVSRRAIARGVRMRIYCHVPVCFRLRIRFARNMERPRSSHDDGVAAIDARPYEATPTPGRGLQPVQADATYPWSLERVPRPSLQH